MHKPSFSMDQNQLRAIEHGIQEMIRSDDNIGLSYVAYIPKNITCCILFYHGGGANNLNYTKMGQSLCDAAEAAVFLFDIRGHGKSEGPRGYSASKELVWSDISSAIQFIKRKYKSIPIYLAGHSSGAGLILNYSCWSNRKLVDGYFMIAPELGYRVAQQKTTFAKANKLIFILNRLSKGYLLNKTLAVLFNYSHEQIFNNGSLQGYTVGMADAVTPDAPFNALTNIKVPVYILIAGEDELIDNEKLIPLLIEAKSKNTSISLETVPNASHIMILTDVHLYINQYINSLNNHKLVAR